MEGMNFYSRFFLKVDRALKPESPKIFKTLLAKMNPKTLVSAKT